MVGKVRIHSTKKIAAIPTQRLSDFHNLTATIFRFTCFPLRRAFANRRNIKNYFFFLNRSSRFIFHLLYSLLHSRLTCYVVTISGGETKRGEPRLTIPALARSENVPAALFFDCVQSTKVGGWEREREIDKRQQDENGVANRKRNKQFRRKHFTRFPLVGECVTQLRPTLGNWAATPGWRC